MEMLDFAAGYAVGKAQGGGGEAVLINKSVSANGTYSAGADNADGYKKVTVNVANSYSAGDEGKVVSNGALVAQTSKDISTNGTHSTVTNSEVVVSVPNSYSAGDEGKVVSNGALVAQTAHTKVTTNGTIDTTLYNSVEVDVSGGGGGTRTEAWDFTGETPLVGTIQGIPVESSAKVSFDSSGAVFSSTSGHIDIPFALVGMTIEVDVAVMSPASDTTLRFINASSSYGFIYRNTGYWGLNNGTWATMSNISDSDYFSGSTVKVVIDNNGYWHIYKDNVLVYEPDKPLIPTEISIGNSSNSINGTISAVRISW